MFSVTRHYKNFPLNVTLSIAEIVAIRTTKRRTIRSSRGSRPIYTGLIDDAAALHFAPSYQSPDSESQLLTDFLTFS